MLIERAGAAAYIEGMVGGDGRGEQPFPETDSEEEDSEGDDEEGMGKGENGGGEDGWVCPISLAS